MLNILPPPVEQTKSMRKKIKSTSLQKCVQLDLGGSLVLNSPVVLGFLFLQLMGLFLSLSFLNH